MATWVINGSGSGGPEPRRRFSDDDKARIVSESMMPEAFVPVEVASAPGSTQPEQLGPGVVEVVGSGGQRIRLAPPIEARVLKAVLAGFG